MIETFTPANLTATALPQPHAKNQAPANDEDGQPASNFENFMDQKVHKDTAGRKDPKLAAVETAVTPDADQNVEAEAGTHTVTLEPDSRIRLSTNNHQAMLRSRLAQTALKAEGKPEETPRVAVADIREKTKALQASAVKAAAKDAVAPNTSQELGELLGMAKAKPVAAEKVEKKDSETTIVVAGSESGDATNIRQDILDVLDTASVPLHHAREPAAEHPTREKSEDKATTHVVSADGKARLQDPVVAKSIDEVHGWSEDKETVRVVSADGKGRPLDISVAKGTEDEHGVVADKKSGPALLDTATVIESRRYLGFTSDSNAGVLAGAIKADPTWTAAMQAVTSVNAFDSQTATEVNTLKLQMNPENLGSMVASLNLKGDDLTIQVQVETLEAFCQLSADQGDIVRSLQDQGFAIDKVTILLAPAEKAETGSGADQQNDKQRGAAGQSGEHAEQRERNPSKSPDRKTMAHDDDAIRNSARAPATGASGGLYL